MKALKWIIQISFAIALSVLGINIDDNDTKNNDTDNARSTASSIFR